MVWWVDKNTSDDEINVYNKYDIEDRIFQSVNIMLNMEKKMNNSYDVYSLLQSGVNIFNIDRTVHDDKSYKTMKKAVCGVNELPEMYPPPYFRPVCLSVTTSLAKPVKIDKEINLVILKDATSEEDLLEFKDLNMVFSIPVLIWMSKCYNYERSVELIKASDGILLDSAMLCIEFSHDIVELCKKFKKPVFSLKPEVYEDIQESHGGRRKLVVIATEVLNDGLDGIVVNGTENTILEQAKTVRNIVEALKVAEMGLSAEEEFEKRRKRMMMELPQLVSTTVTTSASLAALKSEASAILVLTHSGQTARLLSCSASPCPILAITTQRSVARQMHLYKKVLPLLYEGSRDGNWQEECRKRVLFGTDFAVKAGLLDKGAKLVVLAPSEDGAGYCDGFQIVVVPFNCDE